MLNLSADPATLGQAICRNMLRGQSLPVQWPMQTSAPHVPHVTLASQAAAGIDSVDTSPDIGYFTDTNGQLQAAPVFTVYITPTAPETRALRHLLRQARYVWPMLGAVLGLVCGALTFYTLTQLTLSSQTRAASGMPCLILQLAAEQVLCSVQGQTHAVRSGDLFPDGLSRLNSVDSAQNRFVYWQAGQVIAAQVLPNVTQAHVPYPQAPP